MSETNKGLSAYRLETSAVDTGSWVELRGGISVCVRYESSPRVQEASRRLDKKYRSLIMTEGSLPTEQQAERDVSLLVSDILVDWKGADLPAITDTKAVRELLLNPALGDFRRDVIWASRMSENFRAGEQLKIQGN